MSCRLFGRRLVEETRSPVTGGLSLLGEACRMSAVVRQQAGLLRRATNKMPLRRLSTQCLGRFGIVVHEIY